MTVVSGSADDLLPGDVLHRLSGVTFAAANDTDAPPVLIVGVEPTPRGNGRVLTTSMGQMNVHREASVTAVRDDRVRPGAVLLISRRPGLHGRLCALGVPVVRRSTNPDDTSAAAVTARDWTSAPLVVIDAFLSPSTLNALVTRPGFTQRPGTVMVCTEPDQIDLDARQHLAGAAGVLVLPHDEDTLQALFNVACRTGRSRDVFPAILGVATG